MPTSYWDAVAVVGARQLLVPLARPSCLGILTTRALDAGISRKQRDADNNAPTRISEPCSSAEELQYVSQYTAKLDKSPLFPSTASDCALHFSQDDIDEDDSSLSNLSISDNWTRESSVDSESEFSATITPRNPISREDYPELPVTQDYDAMHHLFAAGVALVKLPSRSKSVTPVRSRRSRPVTRIHRNISILTVEDDPEDLPGTEMSSTTNMRLPGMSSRLEITKIIRIKEVPLSPSVPSIRHDCVSSRPKVPPNPVTQLSICFSQPKLKSVSKAVHFKLPGDASPGHVQPVHYAQGSLTGGREFDVLSCTSICDPRTPACNCQGSSNDRLQSSDSYSVLLSGHLPIENTGCSIATPVQVIHSTQSSSLAEHHAPMRTSPLIVHSASLLSILNSPPKDIPIPDTPKLSMLDPDSSRLSILDPPISRPKPIGTTHELAQTLERKGRPVTCIECQSRPTEGDALVQANVGCEGNLPWPPVLRSPS